MEQTNIVHGHCARVIDVPSQGNSYLRVEFPVEHHAEATRQFYGRQVVVALAGPAMHGQPYGVLVAPMGEAANDAEERRAPPPAPAPAPAPRSRAGEAARAPAQHRRSMDAALICQQRVFQRFAAAELQVDEDEVDDKAAAAFMRERCMIDSRAELDDPMNSEAIQLFRDLMADYRAFVDEHGGDEADAP